VIGDRERGVHARLHHQDVCTPTAPIESCPPAPLERLGVSFRVGQGEVGLPHPLDGEGDAARSALVGRVVGTLGGKLPLHPRCENPADGIEDILKRLVLGFSL
jgi:hypothetical protein